MIEVGIENIALQFQSEADTLTDLTKTELLATYLHSTELLHGPGSAAEYRVESLGCHNINATYFHHKVRLLRNYTISLYNQSST